MKIVGISLWIWVGIIIVGIMTFFTAGAFTSDWFRKKTDALCAESKKQANLAKYDIYMKNSAEWNVTSNENSLKRADTAGDAQLKLLQLQESKKELEERTDKARKSQRILSDLEDHMRQLGIKDARYFYHDDLIRFEDRLRRARWRSFRSDNDFEFWLKMGSLSLDEIKARKDSDMILSAEKAGREFD